MRHNTPWRKTKVELLISRDPGLFARFNKLMEKNKIVSHVVVPLVVMFETWNVYHANRRMHEELGSDEHAKAIVDYGGSLVDFAALSASLANARIIQLLKTKYGPGVNVMNFTSFQVSSMVAGPLGIAGNAYSGYQSGRDMIANIFQGDDAAIGHAVMLAGFGIGTVYQVALTASFAAQLFELGTWAAAPTIASGPLIWIGVGVVLAGLALLCFAFKEDSPLEEWLKNGPFSIRKINIPVTQNNQKAGFSTSQGLIVDEQGTLIDIERNSFLKRDGDTVHHLTIKGRQVLGTIGQPFDPSVLNDPSQRFAGHQPGDVQWEVPEGWMHKITPHPGGSREKKEFIKTPNGSHLWISLQNILEDDHIVPGDVLFYRDNTINLKTRKGEFVLGRPGQPIQNKEKLFVDHKDDGDHFRDWCEKPRTAHLDLAAAIFTPQIEVNFTRSKILGYTKPSFGMESGIVESYKGYSSTAHLQIVLPHFIEGKSKLYVEAWEQFKRRQLPDPQLIYNKEIVLKSDPQKSLNLISVDWPLTLMDQRYTWVTVKVRLDLYGDGSLCLPLNRRNGPDSSNSWMIEKTYADRKLNVES